MLCALIQNNVVTGVADLTDDQISVLGSIFEQIIDVSNLTPTPQIGWGFDGSNITGATVSQKITRLAMRQRFTTGELLGILTYIGANPASVVAIMMQNLSVATFVDLSRSDTIAGVNYLTTLSPPLISGARATAILTTVPTPQEIYTG